MYDSLAAVVKESKKSGAKFWQVIQEDDCREEAIDRQKSFGRVRAMYERSFKTCESNRNFS